MKQVLREIGEQGKLRLRAFFGGFQERKHWWDGGNKFGIYGACDGVWYEEGLWRDPITYKTCNAIPRIAIEGTYGTERGHTGSAQFQRFHHALGAVVRGIIGIYLLPKMSLYIHEGKTKKVPWRYEIVLGALNATEIHKTPYLIMDASSEGIQLLKELVRGVGYDNDVVVSHIIQEILERMREFAEHAFYKIYKNIDDYIERKRGFVPINDKITGKIMSQNLQSFTTSEKRAGHIVIGTYLVNRYILNRKILLILPRLTHKDLKDLDARKHKEEWQFLRSQKYLLIGTFDDLKFSDRNLKARVIKSWKYTTLKGPYNSKWIRLEKEMVEAFKDGKISIDWDSIKSHQFKEVKQLRLI